MTTGMTTPPVWADAPNLRETQGKLLSQFKIGSIAQVDDAFDQANVVGTQFLYIRQHMVERAECWRSFLIDKKKVRLYVKGAPGCGKTSLYLLLARMHAQSMGKNVLVIKYRATMSCPIFRFKGSGNAERLAKFPATDDLSGVVKAVMKAGDVEYDLVVYDGVRTDQQPAVGVLAQLNAAIEGTTMKLVCVSSLEFNIKQSEWQEATVEDSMDSWTLEDDYMKAFIAFRNQGKLKLVGAAAGAHASAGNEPATAAAAAQTNGGPSGTAGGDSPEEGDEGSGVPRYLFENEIGPAVAAANNKVGGTKTPSVDDDDNNSGLAEVNDSMELVIVANGDVQAAAISDDLIKEYVVQKYFFAGGSARLMFSFSRKEAKKLLDTQMNQMRPQDWEGLAIGIIPSEEKGSANGLMQQFSMPDNRRVATPLSRYVLLEAYAQCGQKLCKAVQAAANATKNPSLLGWAFEVAQLQIIAVALKSNNTPGVTDSVKTGDNQGHSFQFQPRWQLSYDGEGLLYDSEDLSDALKSRTRKAETKGAPSDSDMPSETIFVRCKKWNQACFDAGIYHKGVLVTLQITVAEKHSAKFGHIRGLRDQLSAAGLPVNECVHIGIAKTGNLPWETPTGTGRHGNVDFTIKYYAASPLKLFRGIQGFDLRPPDDVSTAEMLDGKRQTKEKKSEEAGSDGPEPKKQKGEPKKDL